MRALLAVFVLGACGPPADGEPGPDADEGCPTRLRVGDQTATFYYDDAGRVVHYVEDRAGVIEYEARRAFDELGRLVRQDDGETSRRYTYDAAGLLEDYLENERVTHQFHDALGRFTGYAHDRDGDGAIDDRATYRWDGGPTTFDFGADGRIESTWWFTVMDDRWMTRVEVDDTVVTYEYDPVDTHRLVRRDLVHTDGSEGFFQAFRYDALGRPDGYESSDGDLDLSRDADGRVVTRRFVDPDGVVRDDVLAWDADGFLGMTRNTTERWIVDRGCIAGSVAVRRSPFRDWHAEPYDPGVLVDVTGWARAWDPLMAE